MAKSRVVYKGGPGSGDPVRQFALYYEELAQNNAHAVRDAAKAGEEEMKRLIETRGTGRTWVRDYGSFPQGTPGRTASSPGRVASGDMVNDVTSQYSESSKGNAVARFGWLGGVKDYYLLQEGGFFHVNAGRSVEGMYALQDAREDVIGKLKGR